MEKMKKFLLRFDKTCFTLRSVDLFSVFTKFSIFKFLCSRGIFSSIFFSSSKILLNFRVTENSIISINFGSLF